MTLKKYHLNNFPVNQIFIILKKEFRERFFRDLYNEIGGLVFLSKQIKRVKYGEIRKWKTGDRSIPLWALLSLNKFLKSRRFSMKELENNIIGYKVKSSRKIIYNPKLPLIEDERLVRIVTHIICDGYDGEKVTL